MIVDIEKLEALAKAATPGPWERSEGNEVSVSYEGDEAYCCWEEAGPAQVAGGTEQSRADADFIAAANPAAVLELIAEIEVLRKSRTDWQAECLKRGFEYVREPDNHYVLADVPEMADLLGTLLGVEVRDRENDCYGDTVSNLTNQVDAGIDAFHRAYEAEKERDQLKAEIAGLKTGYEAYERVNAELKAECEALRDDVEQNQYDANAWRNSEESVWIEVFNSEGDDPFISAITGQITVEQLALIQAEILEYREDYFEKGSGLYVFRCAHYQAHHDNVGMTEPAHWETDFESYSPFPWEEEGAAMGQGERS